MAQNSYYWNGVNIDSDDWDTWIRFLFTKTPASQGVIHNTGQKLGTSLSFPDIRQVYAGMAIVNGTFYKNTSPIRINVPRMAYANPVGSSAPWIFYIVLTKDSVTKRVFIELLGPYEVAQTSPIIRFTTQYSIILHRVYHYYLTGFNVYTDLRSYCKFTGIFPDEV